MKYFIIVLLAFALLACGKKETAPKKFGDMTKTIHRTETIRPVGSEDFTNYSVIFVEETITEGTHQTHGHYIIAGIDTLLWPQNLSMDDAVLLLSGNTDTVPVHEDIYVRDGIKNFIFFWRNRYIRINCNCYISWNDEGKPVMLTQELKGLDKYVYKTNRMSLLFFVFVIPLFLCAFVLGKQPPSEHKSLSNMNRVFIGMFIIGAALSIYGAITGTPSQEGDSMMIFIANICMIALAGIGVGKIYRKIKEITSIRNFGFTSSRVMEIPNTNDDRLPDEHTL